MDTLIQDIIIGISIAGAVAFLVYHYVAGRRKKACASCQVMKSYRPPKDRTPRQVT